MSEVQVISGGADDRLVKQHVESGAVKMVCAAVAEDHAAHRVGCSPDRGFLKGGTFSTQFGDFGDMKTADAAEALIPGQIHLSSQNQSRLALGLVRALDYSWMLPLALLAKKICAGAISASPDRTNRMQRSVGLLIRAQYLHTEQAAGRPWLKLWLGDLRACLERHVLTLSRLINWIMAFSQGSGVLRLLALRLAACMLATIARLYQKREKKDIGSYSARPGRTLTKLIAWCVSQGIQVSYNEKA